MARDEPQQDDTEDRPTPAASGIACAACGENHTSRLCSAPTSCPPSGAGRRGRGGPCRAHAAADVLLSASSLRDMGVSA